MREDRVGTWWSEDVILAWQVPWQVHGRPLMRVKVDTSHERLTQDLVWALGSACGARLCWVGRLGHGAVVWEGELGEEGTGQPLAEWHVESGQ